MVGGTASVLVESQKWCLRGRIQNATIRILEAEEESFFPATGWFPIAREARG